MDTFTLGQLVLVAVPREALPEVLTLLFSVLVLKRKMMPRTKGLSHPGWLEEGD